MNTTSPVITFAGRSAADNTFTLVINGQECTYPNNKEGKRQAIVDGLHRIQPIQVGDKRYLPSNPALEVVGVVMYPEGVPSEAAFKALVDVTEKACAHIGYGQEVELVPPQVPFTAWGQYRPQFAPIRRELIEAELAQVGLSYHSPCYEVMATVIWNRVAQERHQQSLSQLGNAQRETIASQVDALVVQFGWQIESRQDEVWYVRPAVPDLVQARQQGAEYLDRMGGLACALYPVQEQLLLGAYKRRYYDMALPPLLQEVLDALLLAYGYEISPDDAWLRPRGVEILPEQQPLVQQALASLTPLETRNGPALLLRDVATVIQQLLGLPPLSEHQVERLISGQPVAGWLWQMEYAHESIPYRAEYLHPPGRGGERYRVLLKAVQVSRDEEKQITLADGLPVLTPVLTVDDEARALVYLEMVGAKQAVKANWAALAGGGRSHWLDGRTIFQDGMKQHVRLQKAMPCGWVDWVLLHKQASLKEMNPDKPFYLLDDGCQPLPPLFYPMLNRCLAAPLLPEWEAYLWRCGREQKLITLLNKGQGQGYTAWKVKPDIEKWEQIVSQGVREQRICF